MLHRSEYVLEKPRSAIARNRPQRTLSSEAARELTAPPFENERKLVETGTAIESESPAHRIAPRNIDHIVWKWVFRVAMLSGVITMILTVVLVAR